MVPESQKWQSIVFPCHSHPFSSHILRPLLQHCAADKGEGVWPDCALYSFAWFIHSTSQARLEVDIHDPVAVAIARQREAAALRRRAEQLHAQRDAVRGDARRAAAPAAASRV
eukprot:gene502-biopygen10648